MYRPDPWQCCKESEDYLCYLSTTLARKLHCVQKNEVSLGEVFYQKGKEAVRKLVIFVFLNLFLYVFVMIHNQQMTYFFKSMMGNVVPSILT